MNTPRPIRPILPLLIAVLASVPGPSHAQEGPRPWTRAALLAPRELADVLQVSGPIRSADEARAAAAEALRLRASDLGVEAAALAARDARRVGETWSVEYEQVLDGLPVVGSRVHALISDAGTLLSLRSLGLTAAGTDMSFGIDAAVAGSRAREAARAVTAGSVEIGAARAVLVPLADRPDRHVPAWQVAVEDPARHDGSWLVTVGGRDGIVLAVEPRVTCAVTGTVKGRGHGSGPSTSSAPAALGLANLTLSASDPAALVTRLTANACPDDQAVISSDGARVAFVSGCDGDAEIWTSRTDGTGLLQLTSNGAADRSPSISADGAWIAFVSEVDGDPEIFVVRSDGTGLLQVSHNTEADEEPSLSGDGALVVWSSAVGGDFEIWRSSTVVPAPAALTANTARDSAPALSLDGSRIAWVSDIDGDDEIFVMNADGTGTVQLTHNTIPDGAPSIREDGLRIVFESQLPRPTAPDAGDPSAVRHSPRVRVAPVLAPDYDLFVVGADGTGLARLTSSHANERAPALSPQGGAVAFTSDEDGPGGIRLLLLGMGTEFDITRDALFHRAPSTDYAGTRGAFSVRDGDDEIGAWNFLAAGAFVTGTTGAGGAYSLPVADGTAAEVSGRLQGLWARVSDESANSPNLSARAGVVAPSAGNDLLFNPTSASPLSSTQVTAYYHTNAAHDGLAAVMRRAPLALTGSLAIDRPLHARVNIPVPTANAFYNLARQETAFFIGAGPTRPNTAYDSVILHEYGHFFDDVYGGIGAGSACEAPFALGEGAADAVSMLILGSPVLGADWTGPGTWLRNYSVPVFAGGSAGRQYDGLDCLSVAGRPEVHQHGEAFAGFAWRLRSSVGAVTAENLLVGAMLTNPPDMQGAVSAVFALAATPAFGGTGSPATSPLYDMICAAAASQGFDCYPRTDQQSYGCITSVCGVPPSHKVCVTEWLGPVVDFESGCEPIPNPDDDGLVVPPALASGSMAPLTFTLKVNPALRFTGRYGGSVGGAPLKERLVYLNVWFLIDNAMGGFDVVKVLGTASGSGISGPAGFGPDTLAYNPDTWAGPSLTVTYTVPVPSVPTDRFTIIRTRLDYGEDCGRVGTCLSSPTLSGPCGTARFGEVEEKQIVITGP